MTKQPVLMVGGYYDMFKTVGDAGIELHVLISPTKQHEIYPSPVISYYFTNPENFEQCCAIVLPLHSDRIFGAIVSFYEPGLETAAMIGEMLKIPCNPISPVLKTKRKSILRESLKGTEFDTIPFALVSGADDACRFFSCLSERRVILKPSVGTGSRDVRLVRSKEEIYSYWNDVHNPKEMVLAEAFVEGTEYSAEGISISGDHTLLCVTEKLQCGEPFFMEYGHTQPAQLEQSNLVRISGWLNKMFDCLGHVDGPTHTEFKISSNGSLHLIEAHLRPGGSSIWDMTRHVTGYDVILLTIQSLLGLNETRPVGVEHNFLRGGAAVRFLHADPGIVKNVHLSSIAIGNGTLARIYPNYSCGGVVEQVHESRVPRIGGHVVVKGASRAEAETTADQISNKFIYKIIQQKDNI